MKFGVVNKSTSLNRFVLHTLQRNFTHLAVITRKTNIKLRYFERGELEKSRRTKCLYRLSEKDICLTGNKQEAGAGDSGGPAFQLSDDGTALQSSLSSSGNTSTS